jgi:hypothetical protein
MKRQNYYHAIKGKGALMSSVMILALVCTSVVVDATGRAQVSPINGTEGVASVVEGRAKGSGEASTTGFAHLQGYAEFSRTSGLMVAGHRVNFTRSTSVFPNVDGLSSGLRSRQLSGRVLTIFGAMGTNGVDAVLVIVQPSASDLDHSWANAGLNEVDESFVPSASDPRVGATRSGSPE